MWRENSCHFNRRLRTDQRRLLAQTPGLQDAFTISINNYNSNAIIKRKDDTDYNNYLRIIILAKRKRKEKNLTFLMNILTKPFEFRCRMFDSFTEQFPVSCITSFVLSVPKTVYRSQESGRPYHKKKKKNVEDGGRAICWRGSQLTCEFPTTWGACMCSFVSISYKFVLFPLCQFMTLSS